MQYISWADVETTHCIGSKPGVLKPRLKANHKADRVKCTIVPLSTDTLNTRTRVTKKNDKG
jgi:hypothetical protein